MKINKAIFSQNHAALENNKYFVASEVPLFTRKSHLKLQVFNKFIILFYFFLINK